MGAVIVTEHLDRFDLDMPGTFSTDPDSIARSLAACKWPRTRFTT